MAIDPAEGGNIALSEEAELAAKEVFALEKGLAALKKEEFTAKTKLEDVMKKAKILKGNPKRTPKETDAVNVTVTAAKAKHVDIGKKIQETINQLRKLKGE